MSNRFGRNQKRALVAQLQQSQAQSEERREIARGALDDRRRAEERSHELLDAIQATREVLGYFFATLPVLDKDQRANHPYAQDAGLGSLAIPVMPGRAQSWNYSPSHVCEQLTSDLARFEQLEAIHHDMQEQFDDVRGSMHIRFRTAAGVMVYAFNERSFRGMKRDKVARIIAEGLRDYMLRTPSFMERLGVKP